MASIHDLSQQPEPTPSGRSILNRLRPLVNPQTGLLVVAASLAVATVGLQHSLSRRNAARLEAPFSPVVLTKNPGGGRGSTSAGAAGARQGRRGAPGAAARNGAAGAPGSQATTAGGSYVSTGTATQPGAAGSNGAGGAAQLAGSPS